MGINKADDDMGHQSPLNGYDSIYSAHTVRDYLFNKRPANVSAKRFVIFFSVDIIMLFVTCGIIDKLTTGKEFIALFVAIAWLVIRVIMGAFKVFVFVGRNRDSIKKGIKSIKELFHE